MNYQIGDYAFDGWKITDKIGGGTSGIVYEVQKEEQDVVITKAMKVMSVPPDAAVVRTLQYEGWDEDGITNYLQSVMDELKNEIKTMISLKDSPHIVSCDNFSIKRVGDLAQWDVLILMEKLTPLDKWVSENTLTESDVHNIALQLSQALMIIEEKGVIHRDIKPENIFVSAPSKHMRYFKIGDFGIARAYDKATRELSKKGTANYMAPEVFRGDIYDNTVDIYSLGLVLYKLLNKNRLPFFPVDQRYNSLDEQSALMKRMSGEERISLPILASKSFGEIILKMIAYDPMDRFRSAEDLYNALKRINASENIVWGEQSANRVKTEKSSVEETSLLLKHRKEKDQKADKKREEYHKKESPLVGHFEGTGDIPEQETSATEKEIKTDGRNQKDHGSSLEQKKQKRDPKRSIINKKKIIIVIALLAILFSIAVPVYVSHKYKLTIEDGSGSGSYKAGTDVEIVAENKEGFVFKKWNTTDLNLSEDDEKSDHLSINMPRKTVSIRAEYEKETFLVTVTGGSGSGTYEYADDVVISASPSSEEQFSHWEIMKGDADLENTTSEETTFKVLSDVEVSAVYEKKSFSVKVTGGSGSGTYEYADDVVISANPSSEEQFSHWELMKGDVDLGDTTSEETTFKVFSDVEVSAVYEDKEDDDQKSNDRGGYLNYEDHNYLVDEMTGLYEGEWVQTVYDFTYYEPVSGFTDMRDSENATKSESIMYRYNKAMDLFVIIYRGYQDYEPTLDGIRNYVTNIGCNGILNATCNGRDVIQFENQTKNYKELNIAFPDKNGAIIQVTIQCSNGEVMYAFGREVFCSVFQNEAANVYLASIGEKPLDYTSSLSDYEGYDNRTDLTRFIGNDYNVLLGELSGIEVIESREDEIKLGTETVSITAKSDKTITRIRISEGATYTVEGISVNNSIEEIKNKIQERGYSLDGNRVVNNESWEVYINDGTGRFVAYRTNEGKCEAIYCGLKDYMPF